jgi:hypothetical protein
MLKADKGNPVIDWKPWEVEEEAHIARIDDSRKFETVPERNARRFARIVAEGIPEGWGIELAEAGEPWRLVA